MLFREYQRQCRYVLLKLEQPRVKTEVMYNSQYFEYIQLQSSKIYYRECHAQQKKVETSQAAG